VHVLPLLVQPVHAYEVGVPMQFTVNVRLLPTVGLELDAASVQLGATSFQSTVTAAGAESPPALVATTE
jgi:hypothetical protein